MNGVGGQAVTPLQQPPSPFSQRAPSSRQPRTVHEEVGGTAQIEVPIPGMVVGVSFSRGRERTLYYCPRNGRHEDLNTLVVGFYDSLDREPREIAVDMTSRANLFWKLKWGTLRLRGLRAALLSLKSVKSFRLYKCCPEEGFHRRIDLPADATEDMRQLVKTYKMLYVPGALAEEWASWFAENINKKDYALEVVFDWSPSRVSIALLTPTALSFVIGLWFNSRDWSDLSTIQTAWGIASYVVTTASLVAGLLALLTALTTSGTR
ncbi:hypothetical protein GQX73_g7612 [Xylaria multiplex]|uniref:Transmembrane protein n=1 Tax=Xylaria multiplex TaxID=323545 RepID=A0A7C8MMB4_9PEZI|nr:hypothetical protein GQX73_g7612 [Xylaria multiplex]